MKDTQIYMLGWKDYHFKDLYKIICIGVIFG